MCRGRVLNRAKNNKAIICTVRAVTCCRYRFASFQPTQMPANPPIVLVTIEVMEKPPAPQSDGNQPPITDPAIMPNMISFLSLTA